MEATRDVQPARKGISLVVAAYNKAEIVETAVERISVELSRTGFPSELIIVNDGSTDATGTLAEGLASGIDGVKVIHLPSRQGGGKALQSALRIVRYDLVALGSLEAGPDYSELKNLIRHTGKHQVVLGYRNLHIDNFIPLMKDLAWNHFINFVFDLRTKDILCDLKVFRKDVLEGMRLRAKGAMLNVEILLKLQRKKIGWKQVPVSYNPGTHDESMQMIGSWTIPSKISRLHEFGRAFAYKIPERHREVLRLILDPGSGLTLKS